MTSAYAKINSDGIVVDVILADAGFIREFAQGNWVETLPHPVTGLLAGIGYGYDGTTFVPKPYFNSIWDSETKTWKTPRGVFLYEGSTNSFQADGISWCSFLIYTAEPSAPLNFTINNETVNVQTDNNGGYLGEIITDTPGRIQIAWNDHILEVFAV